MFNVADIILLLVLFLIIFNSYKKGLIRASFNFFANIISILLVKFLSPYFSAFLRKTILFEFLKKQVESFLNLGVSPDSHTLTSQAEIINDLHLPEYIKTLLFENNNSEIYKVLDVLNFNNYLVTYIAALLLNIISFVLLFIVVLVIIKSFKLALLLFEKLPVVGTINRILGACLGFIQATIIIWVVFLVIELLAMKPEFLTVRSLIMNSLIASKFYESNIFINLILKLK